jgi:hypothetical protein
MYQIVWRMEVQIPRWTGKQCSVNQHLYSYMSFSGSIGILNSHSNWFILQAIESVEEIIVTRPATWDEVNFSPAPWQEGEEGAQEVIILYGLY